MKRRYYLVLCMLGCTCIVRAQEDPAREYEQFRRRQTQEYNDFISRQNREFADFLREEWELFRAMQAVERPAEPKPDRAPLAPDREIPKIPGPVVRPLPVVPVAPPPLPGKKPGKLPQELGVVFYDRALKVAFAEQLRVGVAGPAEGDVAVWWEKMSGAPYEDFIGFVRGIAKGLGLNDWGYLRLVQAVAGQAFAENNDRAAFAFYILKQSGYDVRLGRGGERLYLLATFASQVYGLPYFVLDGKKYYRLEEGDGSLYIFGQSDAMPSGLPFDLRQQQPLAIGGEVATRDLKLLRFPEARIRVPYYPAHVVYYNDVPQTDFAVYFSCPLPENTRQALHDAFLSLAGQNSLPEFVGMLLSFVQTSFEYKTDGEQFGREKYFYPEEVIAYPYSDCEDRSVFFARMVRNLTGAGVIGLHYPGHIATAVCFDEADVEGDSFMYQGKKYVVCDPTYINAAVGMTMPQFRNVKPEIVVF